MMTTGEFAQLCVDKGLRNQATAEEHLGLDRGEVSEILNMAKRSKRVVFISAELEEKAKAFGGQKFDARDSMTTWAKKLLDHEAEINAKLRQYQDVEEKSTVDDWLGQPPAKPLDLRLGEDGLIYVLLSNGEVWKSPEDGSDGAVLALKVPLRPKE